MPVHISASLLLALFLALVACRVYYPAEAPYDEIPIYEREHAPSRPETARTGGSEFHPEDTRGWGPELLAALAGALGVGGTAVYEWRRRRRREVRTRLSAAKDYRVKNFD